MNEIEQGLTFEGELYLAFSEVTVDVMTKLARFDNDPEKEYVLVRQQQNKRSRKFNSTKYEDSTQFQLQKAQI